MLKPACSKSTKELSRRKIKGKGGIKNSKCNPSIESLQKIKRGGRDNKKEKRDKHRKKGEYLRQEERNTLKTKWYRDPWNVHHDHLRLESEQRRRERTSSGR